MIHGKIKRNGEKNTPKLKGQEVVKIQPYGCHIANNIYSAKTRRGKEENV